MELVSRVDAMYFEVQSDGVSRQGVVLAEQKLEAVIKDYSENG